MCNYSNLFCLDVMIKARDTLNRFYIIKNFVIVTNKAPLMNSLSQV